MIRKLRIMLLIILLLGYSKTTAPAKIDNTIKQMKETQVLNFLEYLRYKKVLETFSNQLGYDESRNNWLAINQIGAFGEWQFMDGTLKFLGYGHITVAKFKKDPNIFPPELQKQVLKNLIEINAIEMKEFIDYYEGLIIDNVPITKAGILAACHLAGPYAVKQFILTNGKNNNKDLFGTSIKTYLLKYQKFDLNLHTI